MTDSQRARLLSIVYLKFDSLKALDRAAKRYPNYYRRRLDPSPTMGDPVPMTDAEVTYLLAFLDWTRADFDSHEEAVRAKDAPILRATDGGCSLATVYRHGGSAADVRRLQLQGYVTGHDRPSLTKDGRELLGWLELPDLSPLKWVRGGPNEFTWRLGKRLPS